MICQLKSNSKIEQNFRLRFRQPQPSGNPIQSLDILQLSRPAGRCLPQHLHSDILRRIFKMRKRKRTLQEIADALNTENVLTRRGGKWWPGTVRYILDNPKYRGFIEYLFQWEGEAHVLKPGTHEAILPKARKVAS